MTDPWASPTQVPTREGIGLPAAREEFGNADRAWYRPPQRTPRGAAAVTARWLAVIALFLGVVAYVVFIVGAISFLLGGFLLMFLAVALAGASLALDAAAAVALAVSVATRRRRGTVVSLVLIVLAAIPGIALVDGVYFAEDRKRESEQRRAQTIPRPLPADATPERVVTYVEQLEQTTDFLEVRDKLCGVLVRRARGECLSDPPIIVDEARKYARAVEEPNRVVLTTRDRLDRLIAVRLERSTAGWELVDVPPDFADYTCVVRAVEEQRPPWDCPPER